MWVRTITQFNFIAPPINRGWDGQSDIGLVFYHHADDAAHRKSLSPAMDAARGKKINPTDQTHLSEAETFNFEPSHDPLSYRRDGQEFPEPIMPIFYPLCLVTACSSNWRFPFLPFSPIWSNEA